MIAACGCDPFGCCLWLCRLCHVACACDAVPVFLVLVLPMVVFLMVGFFLVVLLVCAMLKDLPGSSS